MTDEQVEYSSGPRRILSRELKYPVLIIKRDRLLQICRDAESLTGREGGLFVDNLGFAYQVVAVDDSPLLRAPRAERRRLLQEGLENYPIYVHYTGAPVQLSVDDVREKIVWLVSARGHFELPQGLPDLSRAQSVAELVDVLLTTEFR